MDLSSFYCVDMIIWPHLLCISLSLSLTPSGKKGRASIPHPTTQSVKHVPSTRNKYPASADVLNILRRNSAPDSCTPPAVPELIGAEPRGFWILPSSHLPHQGTQCHNVQGSSIAMPEMTMIRARTRDQVGNNRHVALGPCAGRGKKIMAPSVLRCAEPLLLLL